MSARYEYQISFNTFFTGPKPKELQDDAQKLAAAGWRLAGVASTPNMIVCYWEREVQNADGR